MSSSVPVQLPDTRLTGLEPSYPVYFDPFGGSLPADRNAARRQTSLTSRRPSFLAGGDYLPCERGCNQPHSAPGPRTVDACGDWRVASTSGEGASWIARFSLSFLLVCLRHWVPPRKRSQQPRLR